MLNLEGLKKVEYFGVDLLIPEDHYYIATDENGNIFSYTDRPKDLENNWYVEGCGFERLLNTGHCPDWKDSLLELERPFEVFDFKSSFKVVNAWGCEFTVPRTTRELCVECNGYVYAESEYWEGREVIGKLDLRGQEPPSDFFLEGL